MHRSETELALFAGGELNLFTRWRVTSHLRECPQCREREAALRAAKLALRDAAAELPPHLDWERLSSEMAANIRLGLAAGECVAPVRSSTVELHGWRPAAVLAGVAFVVAMAWLANNKHPMIPTNLVKTPVTAETSGVLLEASASGVELNDHGRVLSLQHPKDSDVSLSMTLNTVRARYVDSESGQVTINNVYVQ